MIDRVMGALGLEPSVPGSLLAAAVFVAYVLKRK